MAVHLAVAHRMAGHFSAIYTIFEPGALAAEAEAAGIPVIAFQKRKGFSASSIRQLRTRLRADGAEIVHTHNSSIHHYGAIAGCLAGAAVVNTRHGLALHSAKRQEVYFRAVRPLTRAVVFVCDYGRRYYEEKGIAPEGKSVVIRNGVPVEHFAALRATPGSARPRVRFGTIGRLVGAKAHGDLIEAFRLLANRLPGAELEIWGYGALEEDLVKQIAESGLAGRVQYRGPATDSAKVLQNLDVFVMSSISEGLPLVILEAMAAGVPIVSTRVGGVPEVAPEGSVAWYAEAGNPASLSEAMAAAAASDLAAAGAAAYDKARKEFGVNAMQRAYEDLFRRILQQPTR